MDTTYCYEVHSIFAETKTINELLIELILDKLCTFDKEDEAS